MHRNGSFLLTIANILHQREASEKYTQQTVDFRPFDVSLYLPYIEEWGAIHSSIKRTHNNTEKEEEMKRKRKKENHPNRARHTDTFFFLSDNKRLSVWSSPWCFAACFACLSGDWSRLSSSLSTQADPILDVKNNQAEIVQRIPVHVSITFQLFFLNLHLL